MNKIKKEARKQIKDIENKEGKKTKNKSIICWVILIAVGILLLFGNISIVLWCLNDNKIYWLTLISGWVSGIATIALGAIALIINRKYKLDNDKMLKTQHELEKKTLEMKAIARTVDESKKALNKYIEENNPQKISGYLSEIIVVKNYTNSNNKEDKCLAITKQIETFKDSLIPKYKQLQAIIKSNWMNLEENNKLLNELQDYTKTIFIALSNNVLEEIENKIKEVNKIYLEKFCVLIASISDYIPKLEMLIKEIVNKKEI